MQHSLDNKTLAFECDMCPATETFSADEGDPIADPPACKRRLTGLGWTSKKVPGYSWELYCPVCSQDPDRRPVAKDND